jgi:peptidoglycan hydrolase CwlO-like protein
MTDKLLLLEEKVGKVLEKIEGLNSENTGLKTDNGKLQSELTGLQQEFRQLQLKMNDRDEGMKTTLARLLSRVEELEKIGL